MLENIFHPEQTHRQEGGPGSAVQESGHTDRQEGGLGVPSRGVDTHTGRREALGMPCRGVDTQTGTREAWGVPCRGVEHAKASGEMGQGEERQSRSRGQLDDSEVLALFWFSYFKT